MNKLSCKKVIRYKVTIPDWKALKDFIDMFRYTRFDWIEEKLSSTEYIIRHPMYQGATKQFLKDYILRRWESFGVKAEILDTVESTIYDLEYEFKGKLPFREGITKVECPVCESSGAIKGKNKNWKPCPHCNGGLLPILYDKTKHGDLTKIY